MNIEKNNNQQERESLAEKFKLFFRRFSENLTGNTAKNKFFGNKVNCWLIGMGAVANIANWTSLLIFLRPSENKIILHYNVYFGVDAMGRRNDVFILPSVGIILFLINFFLAKELFRKEESVASYILLAANLMAQLSLLIAALSVIIINY